MHRSSASPFFDGVDKRDARTGASTDDAHANAGRRPALRHGHPSEPAPRYACARLRPWAAVDSGAPGGERPNVVARATTFGRSPGWLGCDDPGVADFTLMGILNVTPDSFSDGGRWVEPAVGPWRTLGAMVERGATMIDVGVESTRPRAEPVDAAEERRRLLPVIEALAGRSAACNDLHRHRQSRRGQRRDRRRRPLRERRDRPHRRPGDGGRRRLTPRRALLLRDAHAGRAADDAARPPSTRCGRRGGRLTSPDGSPRSRPRASTPAASISTQASAFCKVPRTTSACCTTSTGSSPRPAGAAGTLAQITLRHITGRAAGDALGRRQRRDPPSWPTSEGARLLECMTWGRTATRAAVAAATLNT